jgi:hypothetical protein
MVNAPLARCEVEGRPGPWRVLSGVMLIIFAGDFTLGVQSVAAGTLVLS